MINIKAGSKIFELYGSIKEMPIVRHKLMQTYLLQDAGIGNTMADIDARLEKTVAMLLGAKYDEALEELTNHRYAFFAAISGIDFKTRSFATLVYKIDGTIYDDLSTEGLNVVIEEIIASKMSHDDLSQHWELVKKKLIPNLKPISPVGLELTLNTLKIYDNGTW